MLFSLLFLVTACQHSDRVEISPSHTETPLPIHLTAETPIPIHLTAEAFIQPSAIYETKEEPKNTVSEPLPYTQYTISVDYDHLLGTLDVAETIAYINRLAHPLSEIVLLVEPNSIEAVFTLKSLEWEDGLMIGNYHLEQERLEIPLDKPLASGERVQLSLKYHLTLPQRESTFGKGRRQTNLADWYALVPPYQPEQGWLIMPKSLVGETMVYDIADYAVDIRVVNGADKVVIAACAPAQWKGNHYHYEHKLARNFTWSASTMYESVWNRAGNTTIVGFVYPNHTRSGVLAASYVRDALILYTELFGNYPRESLTFIESDFPDGMEYDGLYFLDDYYFANPGSDVRASLAALSVHEVSHQWWLNLVGNNQANEPWLDEALATYSEVLFYERYYPAYVDWWWEYRIHQFKPKGWVNSDVYAFFHYREYVDAVYLQGAKFIAHLRKSLGDDDFFAFLRAYQEKYRYKLATSEGFFNLLSEMYDVNLTTIRQSFFSN